MSEKRLDSVGLNVLLGVSGGIAAYKAVDLASKLTAAGNKVQTVMTEAATKLVGPKSFEAVTGSAVHTSLWESPTNYEVGHIALADWADIIVVSPATADIIAKVANGICDDLLSAVLCACWHMPTIIAPAMNVNMLKNPAVQNNIEVLKKMGLEIVGPVTGRLACGTVAEGRMSEPSEIMQVIERVAGKIGKK